ncbi:MAG: NAD(P)/FAD-dependent oxidoreductase, partial [Anaerovibrio sp.]
MNRMDNMDSIIDNTDNTDAVVVVGAGPAGMMAAIKAAENGASVTLLEKMPRAGKKMLITGKGRCNITNVAEKQELIKNIPGNGKFLHSCLKAYDNEDVQLFFQGLGVPVKVERGGRVFPVSDRAADVVDAMVLRLHELGIKLVTGKQVTGLLLEDTDDAGGVRRVAGVRTADGSRYCGRAVIIATGGASYPGTGSTGDGYRWAAETGHHVVKPLPALVPLEAEDDWVKELQGLALRNVRATLLADGKKAGEMFGEMLFTHFGVSGPIILSLSRQAAQLLESGSFLELEIDLKPALSLEQLDARLVRDFEKYQRKEIKNGMKDLLPGRLIEPVLDAAYLEPERMVNTVTREERHRLAQVLKGLSMVISGTRPIAEAIVTAGGVDVKEINPKT